MRKEAIGTGKTVQEAFENARVLLGCKSDDDIGQEVLEIGRKGGLFRKSVDARVRVWLDTPDEKPVRAEQRPQSAPRAQAESRAPRPQPAPRTQPAPKPQPAPARPQETPRPQPVRAQQPAASRPQPAQAPRPQQVPAEKPVAAPASEVFDEAEEVGRKSVMNEAKAAAAKQFVEDVLRVMEIQGTVEVKQEDDGVVLSLCGDDIGAIIGRRGGTLDSLQYLTKLVANRAEGSYCRITLDCENYREKREKTLEALAKKIAGSVLRNGRPVTLEPMNPYERRIIHATVQRINGVTSSSVGDEPNRRVVISLDGTVPVEPRPAREPGDRPERTDRPERRERSDRSDRGNRGGRDSRDGRRRDDRRDDRRTPSGEPRAPRPSQTVATKPDPERPSKSDDSAAPLYGRIDIE